MYEMVIDETVFISRASEGAVTSEWLMGQPPFIRKKYLKQFQEELKERKERMSK